MSNNTISNHWVGIQKYPYYHCLDGNAVNVSTIEWCEKHTIGNWAYWFDRTECISDWDMTPQIAYIGFTNRVDLFLFKLSAPNIMTTKTDLKGCHDAYW